MESKPTVGTLLRQTCESKNVIGDPEQRSIEEKPMTEDEEMVQIIADVSKSRVSGLHTLCEYGIFKGSIYNIEKKVPLPKKHGKERNEIK